MSRSNRTTPYPANVFTSNPPVFGGITLGTSNVVFTGYIASSGSFGVAVQAFEQNGRAYIGLYRMYGAFAQLTLKYSTSDGTGVAGVDYVATSGQVVWGNGDISARVVQIPLLQTSKITNDTFNFSIDGVFIGQAFFPLVLIYTGGDFTTFPNRPVFRNAPPFVFPITIVRSGRGELDFVGTPYSITRPAVSTTITLQVQRFTGFKGAVGCSFHTTDGTAVSGTDYTGQSGTLSWADGDGAPKNIVITILNGGAGTRSFTVTIDTPTGGVAIGATNIATVNIVAAAPPPNPVAGGSIPNQLADLILNNDPTATGAPGSFKTKIDFLEDPITSFWRYNILFGGILGQKIGGFIGFNGGTDSFGGGTDFNDGTDPFVASMSRFKHQAHQY